MKKIFDFFSLNKRRCYCPICEQWQEKFLPFGINPRPNAKCRNCHSLERHRAIWFFLKEETNLFCQGEKKILHIAPEIQLEKKFREFKKLDYLTGDLEPGLAEVQMDITDIQYDDCTFDFILCSHVLEHIPQDRKAISELFRVLKIGGKALILVPVVTEVTEEDLSITDPDERQAIYGHPDHVRNYGKDFIDRLRSSGFKVQELTETGIVGKNNKHKYGVTNAPLFLCYKNS